MANLDFIIRGDNKGYVTAMNEALRVTTNTTKAIESQGRNLDDVLNKVGATIKGAFAVGVLEQFASKIIDVRKEFQSLQQSFSSLLGSDTKGMAMFDEITQFATTTPLLERDLARAAQTLIGFNIDAEKVIPTLKAIGDVSMGDSQRFQALTLAFAQASSAGKLMGQDLMQMINAGFNPLGELSRTTGKSMAELKDEMSKGAISAEMLEQAFVSATSEGGKFFGMLETQSKTLKGAFSNLEGAIEKFYNALGEGVEDKLVESTTNAFDAINDLTEYLEGNEFAVGHMEMVLTVLRNIIIAYGGWKAAEIAAAAVRSAAASQDQRIAVQRNNALQSIIKKYTELTEVEKREASVRGTTPQEHTNAETAALEQKIAVMQQEIALQIKRAMLAERGAKTALASAQQEVASAQQRVNALEYEQRMLPPFASAEERAAKATEIKAAKTALASAKEKEAAAASQLHTATMTRQELVTKKNAIATELQATATTKATWAQKLFATATAGVAKAWKGMTAAMASNPIGAVITLITLATSAMMFFESETAEANQELERFGKTALKESQNVATLLGIIKATSKDSQVNKTAIKDLVDIYEQYGIHLDKEADLVTQLVGRHNELNNAIHREGEERRKAMQVAAYEEATKKQVEKAQKELADALANADWYTKTVGQYGGERFLFYSADDVRENAAELTTIISAIAQSEAERLTELVNHGYDVTEQDRKQALENIKAAAENIIKDMGLWNDMYSGLQVDWASIFNPMIDKTLALADAQSKHNERTKESKSAMDDSRTAVDLSTLSLEELRKTAITTDEDVAKLAKEKVSIDTDIKSIEDLDKAINTTENEIETLSRMVAEPQANSSHLDWLIQRLAEAKRLLDALNGVKNKVVSQDQKVAEWKNRADSAYTNKAQTDLIKEINEELDGVDQRTPYYKELLALKDKVEKRKKEASGKDSKTKKSGNKSKSVAEKIADEEEKLTELMLDKAKDTKRATEDMETKITEARLAIHADGAAKLKAQRDEEYRKELQDLQRRKEDAIKAATDREKRIYEQEQKIAKLKNPKAKQTTFDKDKEAQKKVAEVTKQVTEQYDELIKLATTKASKEIADAETKALNDYLRQYGDYQQQKLALDAEYADKIAKAETEGDKLQLMAEQGKKEGELYFNNFKGQIHWDTVFNQLERLSVERLKELRTRLQEEINKGNVNAENAKVIAEQINNIDNALADKQGGWIGQLTGNALPALKEMVKLKEQMITAQKKLNTAELKSDFANRNKMLAQNKIKDAMASAGVTVNINDIKTENIQGFIDKLKEVGLETEKLKALFENLTEAERKVNEATQEETDAEEKKKDATKKSKKSFMDYVNIATQGISLISANMQGLSDLLNTIGLGDTGVGKFVNGLAEGFNKLNNIGQDIMSLNVFGVLNDVVGGLMDIGGTIFGINSDGNSKEVNKLTERLTQSNERLAHSVDKLTDEIRSGGGSSAITSYQRAKQMQEQANKNSQDVLRAQMGYHAAHHSNAYYFNLDKQTWSTIGAIVGKKVATLDDLLSLTPEDMDKIRTNLPSIWQMILEQGMYDKSEYWENYADQANKIKEIEDSIIESMTQMSFDSMRDSFVNAILDMDKTAADFADDFKQYMAKAMVNFMVNDLMTKGMQDFMKKWKDYMQSDGLDTDEQADLLKDWNGLMDTALKIREDVKQVTGYTGQDQQSATANGASSITYEQADQLVGRITALQIQGEQRNAMTTAILSSMQSMASATIVSGSVMSDIRNLMAMGNTYLEDVAKYAKAMYNEHGAKLDNINNSIKAL